MKRFKQRGVTSLTVILLMTVAMTWMLGLSLQSSGTVQRAQNDADAALALQGAQRAAEYQIYTSMQEEFIPQDLVDLTTMSASFTPGSTANAIVQPAGSGRHWVTGTCTVNGVTRSVRMYVEVSGGLSVWDNAIFAGDILKGPDGPSGNLNIHGSVHVLGDNIAAPFIVFDFGVDGFVHNNYSGMPAALEAMVPALEIVNGQETLGAELRVANGVAQFSGIATAGTSFDPDGGTSKGNLDGVYTAGGFTGDVYSDNGTTEPYDITAGSMEFPLLSDPYTDEFDVAWPTLTAYLDARSLTIPLTEIDVGTSFEYGPDIYGNWIKFTKEQGANPALLEINGIIKVNPVGVDEDDRFHFEHGLITYIGKGTIYSTGEVHVEMDIIPAAGEVFPTTSALGVISTGEMGVGENEDPANLGYVVAALYSTTTIELKQQVNVVGTLVAKQITDDWNSAEHPSIFQVPELVDNMPPGMPTGNTLPGGIVSVLTWRIRS